MSSGAQVAASKCCDCWSLLRFRIGSQEAVEKAIAIRLTCLPPTCAEPLANFWQIEVNHREEKDTLGVGQAQVRSLRSVPRQPAFVVAAYSALLLAGLLAYGVTRDSHYLSLPKWRSNAERPSCLDLIALLRKEMIENGSLLAPFGLKLAWKTLGLAAAA